jgi:hypothetical protein
MVRHDTFLKWFISAPLNSGEKVGRYESVIDPGGSTDICIRFGEVGIALKEYVHEAMSRRYASHARTLVHWLVEVSYQDNRFVP